MVHDWPDTGYIRVPWHAETFEWARAARKVGIHVAQDTDMQAQWLQCEGTWFVGVDALPSNKIGSIGSASLRGPFLEHIGQRDDLHPAQLSIMYPGYPRPRAGESDAAFRYRVNRDAAHMDGILADGHPKRRYLRERHDWILGLPLTEATPGASPLVVWEGSHHIMQGAMSDALGAEAENTWADIDITDIYVQSRKTVFTQCKRIPLFTRPGEAVLLNPFLVHGIAPWQRAAQSSRHGRMIAYLRPESRDSGHRWLRQK